MLSDAQPSTEFIRDVIKRAIVKMALKLEYDHIEPDALEILAELFLTTLGNIGFQTKEFTELGSRTAATINDILSATVELEIDLPESVKNVLEKNEDYPLHKKDRIEQAHIPDSPAVKAIAPRKEHAPHINDFMPIFPEPHTYVTTAAFCKNAHHEEFESTKLQALEKIRDAQNSLSKFVSKTARGRGRTAIINLIPADDSTGVTTPLSTDISEYKAINVSEQHEWVTTPKIPSVSENATLEQISQNPFVKPPKRARM